MASLGRSILDFDRATPAAGPPTTNVPAPQPTSLRPEFYYALFRGGAPADADLAVPDAPGNRIGHLDAGQSHRASFRGRSPRTSIPRPCKPSRRTSAAHVLVMPPKVEQSRPIQDLVAPTLSPARGSPSSSRRCSSPTSGDWSGLLVGCRKNLRRSRDTAKAPTRRETVVSHPRQCQALDQAEAHSPLTLPIDLATRGYWDPAKWTPLIGQSIPPSARGVAAGEGGQLLGLARRAGEIVVSDRNARAAGQIRLHTAREPRAAAASEAADFLTAHQADIVFGVEPVETYRSRATKLTPSKTALFYLEAPAARLSR